MRGEDFGLLKGWGLGIRVGGSDQALVSSFTLMELGFGVGIQGLRFRFRVWGVATPKTLVPSRH